MSTCKLVNYPWLTVLQMKPNGHNRQPIYHLYPKTWFDELETIVKIIIIILTGPKDKCMNHIVLLVPLISCIRISPRSSEFFLFNDVDPFFLSTALELVVSLASGIPYGLSQGIHAISFSWKLSKSGLEEVWSQLFRK